MDEFSHRVPVNLHRAFLTAAILLLSLTGCEQLAFWKKKEPPLLPPPPQRKTVADPPAKAARPATPPANPAVGLDGSAAGSESVAVPNSPMIDGPQTAGGPANVGGGPQGTGAAAASESNAADQEAGGKNSAEETAAADSDAATDAEGSDDNRVVHAAGNAKRAAKSQGIVQVGGRQSDEDPPDKKIEDPGTDVIEPIEVEGAGAPFKKGQVAASVNGVPIFVDDVLRALPEEVHQKLELAEKALASGELKPEDYHRFLRMLVGNFLQPHIQQEVLLQALKSKLKKEQLDGITKQLDAMFEAETLPKLLKDKNYVSQVELERDLEKHGSSIEIIRAGFRNRQLAQQYLGTKAVAHDGFDLPDVRKYYQEHLEDYAIAAQAKWEQIQIKFSKNGGKEGALKKAREIGKRLKKGEVFAVVAKDCSDGTTKAKGGAWGWTTQGSVKSKAIDEALFERPLGEISSPIETENSIDIIRVLDRTDAHYKPFDDVQEDIKAQLKQAEFQRRVNALLKELIENAAIEKYTDKL